ncbi:hypothetical protein MAPG_11776 [Magnaporthiopsis poae ATCC 64411]|uniref:Uncharacterized protein n=1 Tax=Magnaporthiopsis poae (strain ATCC 64411 / 73-15) TaxID=644358 RepID=A0A0C4EG56_MAGP6|nr:hypothetical protein MAPG_11776 [Magnaporthiopsis poae ATCC 64411]
MYSFSLVVALAAGLATATPVAVPEAQAPKPSCPQWTGLNEVNGIACCVYEYSDRACCSLTGHPLFAKALPCTSEWYSSSSKWNTYWLCNLLKGQPPAQNCTGVPTNGW